MKTDAKLGQEINAYLRAKGVETPVLIQPSGPIMTDGYKINEISNHIRGIMSILGLDLADDSLKDTPDRVGKMYINEIFRGLNYNHFPKCTAVDNKMKYDEMVIERNITAISVCEHHLVTIDQKVDIAYIPSQKVLGLSKLNRIAKFFAQRPQIQERYVEQVFHAMEYILGTSDIAVVVRGKHYCVAQRGVEDTSSFTITSKLGGSFKENPAQLKAFMDLVRSN